jgi:hypothetical protein
MAEDRVIFGADAREYFDVLSRMQQQIDQLGKAHSRAGAIGSESFLRSERIVSRSSANIVTGLFQAQNSAQALADAFLNIEHATVIGLGAAVGVSVGVALFQALQKAKDEAFKLNEEIRGVIASESGPASYSALDALQAKLKAIREEEKKAQAEAQGTFSSIGAAIAGHPFDIRHPFRTPASAVAEQNVERNARALELRRSELETLIKIAAKMKEAADIEETRLHVSEATAAIDKEDADYLEKRAALIRGPGQNLQAVAQLDRIHAQTLAKIKSQNSAENDSLAHARELAGIETRGLSKRDETIAKLSSELAYRIQILKTAQKLGEIKGIAVANIGVAQAEAAIAGEQRRFFQDVATGQAVADIIANKLAQAQTRAGERLIAELRSDRARGVPLGPNAQALLDEANRLASSKAAGIQALAGQDFSGLASLGNLPFSGLQSLNGLTITIK